MNTEQLVKATATVVTIVELSPGDVYKRLDRPYAGAPEELVFGVVQDVMHNGIDAAITAIEFKVDYSSAEAKLKTFSTNTDLRLFPAKPDEVFSFLTELEPLIERQVESATRELDKKRKIAGDIAQLLDKGTLLKPPMVASPAAITAERDDRDRLSAID